MKDNPILLNSEKIINNPVFIMIKEAIENIPGASILIEPVLQHLKNETYINQEKKLNELFETIFYGHSITEDMIDDKIILAGIKTIEAVNRLMTNEKVCYYGNLLRDLILQDERNYDEFEENCEKLGRLSYRQINVIENLFLIQNSHSDSFGNFDPKEVTKEFIKSEMNRLKINETEVMSNINEIIPSGFCISEVEQRYEGYNSLNYYVTPKFIKFRKQICLNDVNGI